MPREALELFYVLLFCGCSKKSDKKVGAGADGNRGCNFKGLGSPVESTSTMNCSSQKAMHLHRLFHTSLADLLAFLPTTKLMQISCLLQQSIVFSIALWVWQLLRPHSNLQLKTVIFRFPKTLQREPWCCTCLC